MIQRMPSVFTFDADNPLGSIIATSTYSTTARVLSCSCTPPVERPLPVGVPIIRKPIRQYDRVPQYTAVAGVSRDKRSGPSPSNTRIPKAPADACRVSSIFPMSATAFQKFSRSIWRRSFSCQPCETQNHNGAYSKRNRFGGFCLWAGILFAAQSHSSGCLAVNGLCAQRRVVVSTWM